MRRRFRYASRTSNGNHTGLSDDGETYVNTKFGVTISNQPVEGRTGVTGNYCTIFYANVSLVLGGAEHSTFG